MRLQSTILTRGRNCLSTFREELGNALRLTALAVLLIPAADLLPSSWARRLARLCGFLSMLTLTGLTLARELRRANLCAETYRFVLAARVRARPFEDFVALRRVTRRRERVEDWEVTELNPAAIRPFRESGAGLIVATGHFARESMVYLYHPRALPHSLSAITARLPSPSWRPSVLRTRLQYGQSLTAIRFVRAGDLALYSPGDKMRRMLTRLGRIRHALVVAVDAPWKREGAHELPLAGEVRRSVSTGTATIARLLQLPIVPCIPVVLEPGRIQLQWGAPIPPPPRDAKEADVPITEALLRFLEPAIALHPDQYVLPIKSGRRWNPRDQRWEH